VTPALQCELLLHSFGEFLWRRLVAFPSMTIFILFACSPRSLPAPVKCFISYTCHSCYIQNTPCTIVRIFQEFQETVERDFLRICFFVIRHPIPGPLIKRRLGTRCV
jgi:hypothetical protein